MNILLDTHIILWALSDHEKLSEKAKAEILSSKNRKLVSLASAWEVAIKISLKKLFYEGGVTQFLHQVEYDGFELMPISGRHITQVEKLPFYHRDPFDRLIVATAIAERMTIITADTNMHLYDVSCIW